MVCLCVPDILSMKGFSPGFGFRWVQGLLKLQFNEKQTRRMRELKGQRTPHWRSPWEGIWVHLRERNIRVCVTGKAVKLLGAWALGLAAEFQICHLPAVWPRVCYISSLCLNALHLENGKRNSTFSVVLMKKGGRAGEELRTLSGKSQGCNDGWLFVAEGAMLVCSWVCAHRGLVQPHRDAGVECERAQCLESHHIPSSKSFISQSQGFGPRREQIKRCREFIMNSFFLLDRKAQGHCGERGSFPAWRTINYLL